MKQVYKFLLLAIIGFSLFSNIKADILYVKPGAGSSAWQGNANVYSDLQAALADAVSGDQIWIAAGTYKPTTDTDRTISFQLKEGVELYGGFAGNETSLTERNWRVNATILSGNIGATGVKMDNSYHVLTAVGTEQYPLPNSSVLDGLIIEEGYANGPSTDNFNDGGGLFLSYASPIILNTWFRDNYASDDGGAIYGANSSAAIFGNVLFTNNRSNDDGGAVYALSSGMKFHACLFYGNNSGYWGGAIYSSSSSQTEVTNSIAWNNDARYNYSQFNSLSVSHSLVQGGHTGTGNMDADPEFVDPVNNDFRLTMESPAINAGDPALVPEWLSKDFAGNSRISDGQINMGIFEGMANTPIIAYPEDKALLSSSATNVELAWQLPEGMAEAFISYTIEYIKNGDAPVSVENIETLNYTLSALSKADFIQWRVAGVLEEGLLNWTPWKFFGIKRDGPLHVSMNGTGNGSSWQEAMDLQEALSVAIYSDQLWVAEGTYLPTSGTDRSLSFQLKDGIELYGGFAGHETELSQRNWHHNQTILSGNIGQANLATDNSYHVLSATGTSGQRISNTTIVDGFIVEAGFANLATNNYNYGGGLYLDYASPIIRNTWFRENHAAYNGGAVYEKNASAASFGNVLFTGNSANNNGGAVFSNSSAMTFLHCVFYLNQANSYGGAIYGKNSRNSAVINSIAWLNEAGYGNHQLANTQVTHSLIQGGYSGTAIVHTDPLFVDPENGDFRLSANSPAILAGNPGLIQDWVTVDYAGNPRSTDGATNMGILEGKASTPILALPADKAILDSNIASIQLSWLLPEDLQEEFVSFSLEYIINDNAPVSIENISALNFNLGGFNSTDIVKWRVAGVEMGGLVNWSPWRVFAVERGHPIYVSANGIGNGTSWSEAMNFQEALSMANYGDQIWVSAGTYLPTTGTDRAISFQLKDGVELYGGFAGHETELSQRNWRHNKTILSGDIGESNLNTDNSYRVVSATGTYTNPISNTTVLDGFIIEGGYANLSSNYNNMGGGLYLNFASPIIRNSWFRENHATSRGGAVFAEGSISAKFGNVLFTNNSTEGGGGAAFANNSSLKFSHYLFFNKTSGSLGAAIYNNNSNNGTEVTNSIAWNHGVINDRGQFFNLSVTHSLVQGANTNNNTLINTDPLFNDPENGDFRLPMNSPAVKAGNPELLPDWLSVDYANEPRVTEGETNMGIYVSSISTPLLASPEDQTIFNSNTTIVELSWQLPEGQNGVFSNFTLEFIKNNNPLVRIENLTDLNYSLGSLVPTDIVQWRVAGVVEEDLLNWSQWRMFTVKRGHPIHVKVNGSGNGASWQDAMGFQEALSTANFGDQLWVAAGTYLPTTDTDRSIAFQLKHDLEIYGGFAGHETDLSQRNWQINKTILSGDIGEAGLKTDNSYHVVMASGSMAKPITNTTILDGFIVEGGYANLTADNKSLGGGLFLNYASPLIRNTWFRENQATGNGGAVYIWNSPSVAFGNVLFTNNTSGSSGGAVYASYSTLKVAHCLFYDNYAEVNGAVIFDNTVSGSAIANSIAWNNESKSGGNIVSTLSVTHSLVQGQSSGIENIDSDPLFSDPDNGDFRLPLNSPAIKAGNPTLIPEWLTVDYNNHARTSNGETNMGIYEGGFYSPLLVLPENRAVLNGDLTEVELSWELPEGNTEVIEDYILEYTINDNAPLRIENLEVLNYTLEEIIPTDRVQWRVAGVTEEGLLNWSERRLFIVKRNHPVFVTENGNGDGSSWVDAMNLQEALSSFIEGDQIWVAAGTYKPTIDTDRSISFQLNEGIELYGGFAGDETVLSQRNWRHNLTILSGDIGEAGIGTDNSYHVISALGTSAYPISNATVVDGFIIEGGHANLSTGNHNRGGGLLLSSASPIIRNTWFRDNYASGPGGAIYIGNSTASAYGNVLFTNNTSAGNGAAIYSNYAEPIFYHCLFYGNISGDWGGAIYDNSFSDRGVKVINSIAWHNEALNGRPQFSNIFSATHSLVQGNYTGTGNLDADPLLIDPANGDFRLSMHSPAKQAGNIELIPDWLTVDFANMARTTDGETNMGIYESTESTPILSFPEDNTFLDSHITEVSLLWQLPEGVTPDFTSYTIELIINDNTLVSIENIEELNYTLGDLMPTDIVRWRAAGVREEGLLNWSPWHQFRIKRDRPVYVVENGTGNGSSWQDAMNLQEALSTFIKGDHIWVAAGTYHPTTDTDRNISFQLKEGVELYGGFAGNETNLEERNWRVNKTILSGDINETENANDNSYHVIEAVGSLSDPITTKTILDGFIVEAGYADGAYNTKGSGAGLYLSYASPLIRNTWFRDNYARGQGGAVFGQPSASPVFGNVVFTDNTSANSGGAVFSYGLMQYHNCLFYNNYSNASGGAIYDSSTKGQVINSIAWNNVSRNQSSQFSHVSISHSLVQGGYPGTGNLDANPFFIDPENSDFRLAVNSPAIHAGNPQLAPDWLSIDYAGISRITDGEINMGVYEGSASTPLLNLPLDNAFLTGDITEVELSWQLPEVMPQAFTSYTLEVVINDSPPALIENLAELNYTVGDLIPTNGVKWRVAGVLEEGLLNWSPWHQFSIKRDRPVYVVENGSGDGSSWQEAMSLQEALSDAFYGDQIWVAAGTHKPTNDDDSSISFQLINGIELYGGFEGHETELSQRNWRQNKTILSGDIGETGLNTDNSSNIIKALGSLTNPITNSTIVDGFIVEGGYAQSLNGIYNGGGLYLDNASPLIRNTWFRENHATNYGGAVYSTGTSSAIFGNVLFTNNSARYGAGAYAYNSSLKLYHCLFYGNTAEGWGGAIFNNNADNGTEVINSIAWNNEALVGGYQFYNLKVTHSLVQGGYSGTGNISSNPLFTSPENGDFRLYNNSAAIHAGNPELLPDWLSVDFAGNSRTKEEPINMGIYGGSASAPMLSFPEDNTILDSDLTQVELSWQLPEEMTGVFVSYIIDVKINDNAPVSIENLEVLNHTLSDLNPTNTVLWRVAGVLEDGLLNWSPWQTFRIKRAHPIYVAENADGSGSSWQEAMSLQAALASAFDSDQIWVAAGTYKPTEDQDRTISFELKNGVALYGGFAGNETELSQRNWKKNETILSGDIGEMGVDTDNSYRILSAIRTIDNALDNSIVDGFIVERGYANGDETANSRGGAMSLRYASPILQNVWFRDNYSAGSGGAVYGADASKAAFGNVLFTNNRSGGNGGALYTWNAQMTLLNSVFYANSSVTRGGAIENANYTYGARVVNSIFLNNTSETTGHQAGNVKIDHSLVQGGYPGTGNLSTDPELNDPENGDFRLRSNSPAIDAGNTEQIPEWLTVDFAGQTRMSDGKINMGLYEDFIYTPVLITPLNNALFDKGISEVELTWQIPAESSETYSEFVIEYIKNGEEPLIMETTELLSFVIAAINPLDNIQWRVAGRTPADDFHWSEWRNFSVKRANPLYVTVDGIGGGTSWQDPMNLQAALSASVAGDQIWAAAGTYLPTDNDDRTISFELKKGIELYGGFAGHETELSQRNWRLHETILSGDIGEKGLNTDNSYHVLSAVSISNSTLLDGVIVEGGYADLSNLNNDLGGGLYLSDASPVIRNVWFRENFALGGGGAVYGVYATAAQFGNVLFTKNNSGKNGGAVRTSSQKEGPAFQFHNCLFYDNYATDQGGAIYAENYYNYTAVKVVNSIIWGNNAGNYSAQTRGIEAEYSLIQSWSNSDGMISSDPLFMNAEYGDFRLRSNSEAIGAGQTEYVPEWLASDFTGSSRISDGAINMGLYEGFAYSPMPLFPQDNSVLDTNTSELELSWQLPEENIETISSYSIEYRKNNGNLVIIEVVDVTTYMLDGINAADKIEWRVAAVTAEGNSNWSGWNSFNIRRDQPIFVKSDGNGEGASWYDAASLQEALSIAVDGEQIWVAAGIYKPTDGTDRNKSFQLKDGIALYGGFAGDENTLDQRNWRMNETILSGNIGETDTETDNSYHVLVANGSPISPITNTTLLDGLIVEAGYADSYVLSDRRGSGLYLKDASPVVQNLWFRNNYAAEEGGAVFGINFSAATFENVLFTKNKATETGGAVYSMNSGFKFNNCLFYNNYSDNLVGAISGTFGSGIQVINSIIWNNNARIASAQISSVSAIYSIVEGGYTGTENIDADPLFMDPENGNFTLKPGSPAIDAGSSDLLPEYLTRDYLGLPRVQGSNVDMGPFESIVLVNTMPANHTGAMESAFFGLEFRWGFKDGAVIDESVIPNMLYRIQVWEIGDVENPLHDAEITPGGFFPTDYNTTNLFGFNPGKAYEWKIAMLLDGMEIWSDPTVFYIGHDHVLHVKEGSEGTTGTNWDNAFGTLHEALEYALPGDEIWVAAGTYYPVSVSNPLAITTAERETSLHLKTGISIFGGFVGTELIRNQRIIADNPTVISGDLSGTGDYSFASKHLFANSGISDQPVERATVMDGLIFEYASQSAIVNQQASPTIRNSIFRNNRGVNGAALSNTDSSPLLIQVLLHKNEASAQGGAVWSNNESLPEMINVTIGNNAAEESGGVFGPATIKNSIVYHNIGGQVSEQATIVYSCVEDGFEGEGNTAYDPTWVDMAEGDFRLLSFSSAIDGGNQSLLPEMLIYDLANKGRLMNNTIDMGAYEAQTKGLLALTSSSIGDDDIHRNDMFTIGFNQPAMVLSEGLIRLTSSGTEIPVLVTVENGAIVIGHNGLKFGQTYQLTIQPGAIAFEGNPTIVNQTIELDFATKTCEPVNITSLVSAVQLCPYGPLELEVQTSGEVSSFKWIFNNEDLGVNSSTLAISSITPDQFGVYTVEIEDHCQMGTSQQVTIGSVETNALTIIDKWETIYFADNQSDQLSDYSWFLDDTFLSNAQFVDMTNKSGQLSLHALDALSGCVLRSEVIELSGGKRSAMVVWPNPVHAGNSISVLLPPGFEPSSLKLYDISGRLMVVQKAAFKSQFDFDKTDFIPGVYILQLEDEQGHREFERITID